MTNQVIRHIKNIIFLIVLILYCKETYAQLTVTTEVEGTATQPAVIVNGVHHATVGAVVKFNINFALQSNQRGFSVKSAKIQFNGAETNVMLDEHGHGVVSYPAIIPMTASHSVVTLIYSYEQEIEEEQWEVQNDVAIQAQSQDIVIHSVPLQGDNDMDRTYSTANRNVYYTGGNPNGWRYTINGGAERVGNTVLIEKPNSDLPSLATSLVSIRNYAPDGTTIWYESSHTFETYFYNTPSIKVSDSSEKKVTFYKNTVGSEWKIDMEGANPDGWVLKWTGGEMVGSDASYSPFTSDVTENTLNKDIMVEVTNLKDNVVLFYQKMKVASINIYKEITHDHSDYSAAIYSGESHSLTAPDEDGGIPGGWQYEWSNGATGKTINVTPSVNTDFILTAKNYNGSELVDTYTKTYKLTSYSSPVVTEKIYSIVSNYLGQDKTIELYSTADLTNKIVDAGSFEMLLGDVVSIGIDCQNGVESEWSYDVIQNKTLIAKNAPYTFNPTEPGTYVIDIVAHNADGKVTTPYTATITRTFNVIAYPVVDITASFDYYVGETDKYTSTIQLTDGWNIEWEDGTKGNNLSLSIEPVSARQSKDVQCYTRRVCQGIERAGDTQTVTLVAWPEPKLTSLTFKLRDKNLNTVKNITYFDVSKSTNKTINVDLYNDDIVDIAYSVSGGYTDTENTAWKYTLSTQSLIEIKSVIASLINTASITMTNAGSSNPLNKSYILKFTNTPNSSLNVLHNTWFNEEFTLNVNVWRIPQVEPVLQDSIGTSYTYDTKSWSSSNSYNRVDVYAGGTSSNNVNFVVNHSYGYTASGSWDYTWTEDGTKRSTNENSWTYTPTTTASYTDKQFTVSVNNHIGDNYGIKYSKTYYARVWKKAEFSKPVLIDTNQSRIMTDNILATRSDNITEYSVMPTLYGYNDGNSYYYDWSGTTAAYIAPNSKNGTWINYSTSNPVAKGISTSVVSLRSYNVGPYGRVWDSSPIVSNTITIYNRPSTPTSLVKKGTGASGTMICTTSISDDDLEQREYFLVFGYTGANGVDHDLSSQRQVNPGAVRWSESFSSSEINNSSNRFYVYAKWIYDDKVSVTSGKRYVGGSEANDMWDGSVYSNSTRSSIFAMEQQATSTQIVKGMAERENSACDANEHEVVIRVMTLDGQIVPEGETLKTGIYLQETLLDGKKTTRKFYVK